MPLYLAAVSWLSLLLVGLASVIVFIVKRRASGPVGLEQDDNSDGLQDAPPTTTPQITGLRPGARPDLGAAHNWGYQLQDFNVTDAAASPFDLLVIDFSLAGDDASALSRAQLEDLKMKPDGSGRIMLAYLSVGEAESYRSYWRSSWASDKPRWLLSENPDWPENFAVRFWDRGWQKLMFGGPDAYIDKIIAQGFDGVYLDKCDVYEDLARRRRALSKSVGEMETDMVEFVDRLSAYAKEQNPGFVIVMQNAEGLLVHEKLRRAIDGVAKEELIFGQDGGERRNEDDDFQYSRHHLDKAKAAGKPVFVVEYLTSRAKIREAQRTTRELGYVLAISDRDRELDRLVYADPMA